jgi:hypothetical protein
VKRSALAVVVLAVVLLSTVRAHAFSIRPGPLVASTVGSRYVPYTVVVPKGSTLRLLQLDPTVRHDVVSSYVIKGRPMFATDDTLGFAETQLVSGVEKLRPALYPFSCSIHPEMFGQLVVRG